MFYVHSDFCDLGKPWSLSLMLLSKYSPSTLQFAVPTDTVSVSAVSTAASVHRAPVYEAQC